MNPAAGGAGRQAGAEQRTRLTCKRKVIEGEVEMDSNHALEEYGVLAKQLDSGATLGGGKTVSSTVIAAGGRQMPVVQLISRASDLTGHKAVVKSLTSGR